MKKNSIRVCFLSFVFIPKVILPMQSINPLSPFPMPNQPVPQVTQTGKMPFVQRSQPQLQALPQINKINTNQPAPVLALPSIGAQAVPPLPNIQTPAPVQVIQQPVAPLPSMPALAPIKVITNQPAPLPSIQAPAPVQVLPQSVAPLTSVSISSPISAPLPAAQPAQNYQQELLAVKKSIEEISSLKKILKSQLEDLDIKLIKTQDQLVQIKKKGFEILSKETEAEASQSLSDMKNTLSQVQALQKTIETSVNQDFNATVQKIKNLMASTQTQLQGLTSKASTLTPQEQQQITLVQSSAITTNQQIESSIEKIKTNKPKSGVQKIVSALTNIVAGSLSLVISSLTALKELIAPEQPTIKKIINQEDQSFEKKKIIQIQPALAPLPNQVTQSVGLPALQPLQQIQSPTSGGPAGSTSNSSFANDIKMSIATIDQIVQNLDAQRVSIKQTMKEVKDQSKELRLRVEKNPHLSKSVAKKLIFEGERDAAYFKKYARDLFDIFLDGVDVITTTLTTGLSSVFSAIKNGIEKAWSESSVEEK